MFKDIIVGITPTGVDECAVKAAAEFAEKFEAKLYLTHVAGMEQGWGSIETLEPSGETGQLKDRMTKMYGKYLESIPDSQIKVVPGNPAQRVVASCPAEEFRPHCHGTAHQGVRGKSVPRCGAWRAAPLSASASAPGARS